MTRRLPLAVISLWLITGLQSLCAQDLSIADIDASRFPEMRARFLAVNADGSVASPSADQLTLSEDGVPVTDLSVTCAPSSRSVPLSSVLVIDVSGSMLGENLQMARAGAHAWIDALAPGRSECAITSFDHESYLGQDFTTDHTRLHAAVDNLAAQGGTDYNKGLLLPPAGGLQVTARGRHRRVIVFLTDGLPNGIVRTDEIIAEAKRQGCVIYPVTIGFACPVQLREIGEQTGGEWFSHVKTAKEIELVYRMIALREQNASMCEVAWRSPNTCSEGARSISMRWSGAAAVGSYHVDRSSTQLLELSPLSLHIRPSAVGVPFDTTITVTATQRTVIRSITSSNPAFSITPTTLRLDAGESATLTVRYTPADSSFQWTEFGIVTNECTASFQASAAFPLLTVIRRTLEVTHPNGGERFIAGSDTVISWSGIPLTEKVRIEYSIDNGATWIGITDEASGGSYTWRVPNTPSPICRVRVSQLKNSPGKSWVRGIGSGSTVHTSANSVTVDAAGNSYVCGAFGETMQVDGKSLVSAGQFDLYVSKYNPDGVHLWTIRSGGRGNEVATSIALDKVGNIIIGGACYGEAEIGETRSPDLESYTFVAKLTPDGSFVWSRILGGSQGSFSETGQLDVDANGDICVTGSFYSPTLSPGVVKARDFGGIQLTSRGGNDIFLVKMRSDGSTIWAKGFGGDLPVLVETGERVRFDRDGSILVVGHFSSVRADFNGTTVRSAGKFDMFLARFSANGDMQWVRRGGGKQNDIAYGLAIDSIGNIYVGGAVSGPATFDGIEIPADPGVQMFLAKYHSDGNIEWAVQAASDFLQTNPQMPALSHQVDALAVDKGGNVYMTGSFMFKTDMQGIPLESRAWQDIHIAMFRPDGNIAWARRAGTTTVDRAQDIAVAPDGGLFIAGSFAGRYSSADFGADTIPVAAVNNMGYLWHIAQGMILQSDSSNSEFAIVATDAESQDVDMGRVIIGQTRDSVITAYVRNVGTSPLAVQQISFGGPDSAAFDVVSGIPSSLLDPGASSPVEFRFRPQRVGIASATIFVVAGGDTLRQSIVGEGIEPMVEALSPLIDFGSVLVGTNRDSLHAVTIINRGSAPLSLSAIRHDGPNAVDFTTLAGTTPTLLPGDTLHLDLRFAPARIGRTSGRLLFEFDGVGSPASVLLFGEGVSTTPASAALLAASFEARAGDEVDLPITFAEQTNLQHSGATSIVARLRFNATLLYPVEISPSGSILDVGEIVDGEREVIIEMPLSAEATGELGRIRFVALLGNDSTTAVTLEDAVSIGGEVSLTSRSAEFRLLDLCYDGGARLFNPDGQTAILKVQQLPGGLAADVEVETVERGEQRLVLVDMLGREVVVLADGEQREGRQHYTIDTRSLPTGSYYLVLTTPTMRRVARLNIAQ